MLAYTYVERDRFKLIEKPKPILQNRRDTIVRVKMTNICTSGLHIKHGSVPRAVPGITVGHEMVGIVAAVGDDVSAVRPRGRVVVNVETFRLAWPCARPNALVTVVALYDTPQIPPLPEAYSKNLTFKTGGVDRCQCARTLKLIEWGKIDAAPLITHTYLLERITEAYELFEERRNGVVKVAVETSTANHQA